MTTETPRPERVTLTDEEPKFLRALRIYPNGTVTHEPIAQGVGRAWEYTATLLHELDQWLAAREQALREEVEAAAGEWANDYANWMANNPGPSGIPSDPPLLDSYLARIARGETR